MLWSCSAIGSEIFNSLSCSQKNKGTQIYFINGVLTPEFGEMSASKITELIVDRIEDGKFKKRIDQNEKVFIDYIYNNSEEFGLDLIQATAQKIRETGEFPYAKRIGKFLFQSRKACLASPLVCTGVIVGLGGLLAKQAYISNEDLRQMADLIQFHLDSNYKVIVISHSQGNLYANLIYTELLRRGISSDTLNKYFGNLQIASVASSIKAKNNRLFSAKEDMLVKNVRKVFPTTIKENYSFINSPPSIDFLKHGMIESYLSDEVFALGPRQGKGNLSRKASDVFLENLEEIAWMLANNDSNCCNGRDGRMYRKDYDSEPEKGFLEKTVEVDKGVRLEIDEKSQICKNVSIHSSSEPSFKIKLVESTIVGEGPIDLKGNLFFKLTDVSSSYVPDKPLKIEGTTVQPLTFEDHSTVEGNLDISGAFVASNAKVSGTGKLKGSLFHRIGPGINTFYPPRIEGAQISGESDIEGFYSIKRNLEDTKLNGFAINEENGSMKSTILEPNAISLKNGKISGPMYIVGRVDSNVTIEGALIMHGTYPDYSGLHVNSGSRILANSSLKGAAYIGDSTFSGTLNGDVSKQNQYSLNITNSIVTDSNVFGATYILNSTLTNSSASGLTFIYGSHFSNSNFYCNAYVIEETGSNKSFGCGYVTGSNLNRNRSSSNSFENYEYAVAEWERWTQAKQEKIKQEF